MIGKNWRDLYIYQYNEKQIYDRMGKHFFKLIHQRATTLKYQ